MDQSYLVGWRTGGGGGGMVGGSVLKVTLKGPIAALHVVFRTVSKHHL